MGKDKRQFVKRIQIAKRGTQLAKRRSKRWNIGEIWKNGGKEMVEWHFYNKVWKSEE